jgi:DNA replication protein DnaC
MISKVPQHLKCRQEGIEDAQKSLMEQRKKIWREYSGIPDKFKYASFDNYKLIPRNQDQANIYNVIKHKTLDMILCGAVGTGKTHLACAKISQLIDNGIQAQFVQLIKLIRSIKSSWTSTHVNESDIIKQFTEVPFLVIDEIGVQFESETEKQYLTEIINDRYNNKLSTYLISNMTVEELAKTVGDRVVDRFRESNQLGLFKWESYRL